MADVTVTSDAIDDLRINQFFDPDAELVRSSSTRVELASDDGYDLVLQGRGFEFNRFDEPTDGTITDIFLYDRFGDLVGRIDDVSYSLEDYYDLVPVDGRPIAFTSDLLSGGDDLTGGAANDFLEGYGGADSIAGGSGDDILEGGSGNDTLSGGSDDDELDGGSGDDRGSGGSGSDILFGDTGDDTLTGDAGNDELYGESGNDSLAGGSGNDEIFGGANNDRMDGGDGNDRLEGSTGNDTAFGGVGDDTLGGGDGNDVLSAGVGNDKLFGDAGNDRLNGERGNDTIEGGSGGDTIVGGSGADLLTGGAGRDAFRFDSINDRGDTITDFTRGEDRLIFAEAGFSGLTADFDLVNGSDPTATSGDGTFLFDTDSHRLSYDSNGSAAGGERLIATLEDVSSLSRSDFSIV